MKVCGTQYKKHYASHVASSVVLFFLWVNPATLLGRATLLELRDQGVPVVYWLKGASFWHREGWFRVWHPHNKYRALSGPKSDGCSVAYINLGTGFSEVPVT